MLSCDTVCDSAVFRMTAHDICANSTQDPVCKQVMGAHDIYANIALGICKLSMQIAFTHKGQGALWVTNGCTSMLNPITI